MRWPIITIAAAAACVTNAAIAQVPAPAPAAIAEPSQEDVLRQQLLDTQQEVLRLRRELADQTTLASQVAPLQAKNRRLVEIGNELIAAYGQRYGRSQYLPFQLGRRRFEAELQAVGDEVYQNRADAVAPPPAQPAPSPDGTAPQP